jgi:hypothetical protein
VTVRKFSSRRISSIHCAWPIAFCLLAVAGGCTGSELKSEQLDTLRSEQADLRRRFFAVQNRIRRTQAAALDSPGVRATQDRFYTLLREEMVSNDPAAANLLERSRRIGADLDRVSGPVLPMPDQADEEVVPPSERRFVAGELAAAERELRPHITLAMRKPRVAEAFQELQDSVAVTMTRIDPRSAASIERLNELTEQMRQIEIEIENLEGGG